METTKVGIREFRSDLAEYIASSTPVAVTRHGQTVGYFIPTQGQIEADLAALKHEWQGCCTGREHSDSRRTGQTGARTCF